jgi:CheY-like chemotaxis protein
VFAAAILLRKLAPSLPDTEPLKQHGRNTGGNRSGSLGARRRGILYVFHQWRQVQISPGTQAQDREAGTHPGASETRPEPTQDRKLCNRKNAESGGRMTAITFASPLSGSLSEPLKKKRVLLLDTSAHKRELRAEIMRKVGIEVDSAADITEARSWWKVDLYDLVLVNTHNNQGHRDKFCDDIRAAAPSQRFAFLVGKPEYLSHSPSANATDQDEEAIPVEDVAAPVSTEVNDLPQRWGILEASRRISAVRSASNARTQAIRNRPTPPRDLSPRQARTAEARTLDDLLRKDMQ